jgi:hypothetical protein
MRKLLCSCIVCFGRYYAVPSMRMCIRSGRLSGLLCPYCNRERMVVTIPACVHAFPLFSQLEETMDIFHICNGLYNLHETVITNQGEAVECGIQLTLLLGAKSHIHVLSNNT